MTVDFLYKEMQDICSKNQAGYISPANFNDWINQGQLSYLDYLFGLVEQYQPGRPIPRVQLGLTQTVRQILTAFIDSPSTLTVDGSGLSPYPSDFQRVDAMYTIDLKKIKYVQQDSLASYLQSRISPISSKPIYLIQSDGFQFYPITLGSAKLSYVKTPRTIVWAFNLNPNGIPIYDSTASVDPLWYDLDCYQVLGRALRIAGTNLQSPLVIQYADKIINQGQ